MSAFMVWISLVFSFYFFVFTPPQELKIMATAFSFLFYFLSKPMKRAVNPKSWLVNRKKEIKSCSEISSTYLSLSDSPHLWAHSKREKQMLYQRRLLLFGFNVLVFRRQQSLQDYDFRSLSFSIFFLFSFFFLSSSLHPWVYSLDSLGHNLLLATFNWKPFHRESF
jgi:hypothetical protein